MHKKPFFITFLNFVGNLIPGNYLKTFIYLNFIQYPRKIFRLALTSFYRMDHIYDVIEEFKSNYKGNFSILEFGVADGYAFTKKLHAVKYLRMDERITLHGFDTFEGMPKSVEKYDEDLIANDSWVQGQFKTDFDKLNDYCSKKYKNFKFHKGLFSETLTPEFLNSLKNDLPILIWMDADYYSSTRSVFEKIIPYIPNGCVIYFDEPEFNYGSRFTGESKIIYEINTGKFGDDIELILDTNLSLNQKRVYRFINFSSEAAYQLINKINIETELHKRTNDSPFP